MSTKNLAYLARIVINECVLCRAYVHLVLSCLLRALSDAQTKLPNEQKKKKINTDRIMHRMHIGLPQKL